MDYIKKRGGMLVLAVLAVLTAAGIFIGYRY